MSAVVAYLAYFGVVFPLLLAIYLVVCGLSYWVYFGGAIGDWSAAAIQPGRSPAPGQARRELGLSLISVLLFALASTAGYALYRHGLTQVYTDLAGTSAVYFVASILLLILAHDAYFYWAHRLLHWKPLFRRIHRVHHQFRTPTPWASYALHPAEGLIMSGYFALLPVLIPCHPLAFLVFVVVQNIYSTAGHAGHDNFPPVFRQRWYLAWHNTPTHHDDHHRYVHGNFGHYLSLWDHVLGTHLHVDRDARPETAEGEAERQPREAVA